MTFVAGEEIWALKFGSPGAFERFLQKYNKAGCSGELDSGCGGRMPLSWSRCSWCVEDSLPASKRSTVAAAPRLIASPPLPCPQAAFENRFGQEQTEAAEVKLFGDFAHNLNAVENDESRQAWVEDMDLDKPDPRVRSCIGCCDMGWGFGAA